MRWEGDRESGNVEDRRGVSGPVMAAGGGIGTVIIIVLALLFHQNPAQVLQKVQSQGTPGGQVAPGAQGEDQGSKFVRVVLADTEDVWHDVFRQMGKEYREPKLVLFTDRVQSACGGATSAVGPFYCPEDEKVYIDLAFYDELKNRFHAPGDFAQAYVIAHEVGHHVQKLMGISERISAMQARASKTEANRLSVRLELQADFFAGVWANHAQKMKNIIEPGDIESALQAASAIGDDKLQMKSRGYVVPDSFTHGTSAQRVGWFRKGYETGDVSQGDTFNMPDPPPQGTGRAPAPGTGGGGRGNPGSKW